jgi:hypothetical protein
LPEHENREAFHSPNQKRRDKEENYLSNYQNRGRDSPGTDEGTVG